MRHVISTHLSNAEQTFIRRWSIAAGGILGMSALLLIAGAVFTSPVLQRTSPQLAGAPRHACSSWDEGARESVASLLRDPSDAALRELGDMVFRLRRARRNCEHGWIKLACQDYQAITRTARNTEDPLPASSSICWPALQSSAAPSQ